MTQDHRSFSTLLDVCRLWCLRLAGMFIGIVTFSVGHADEKTIPTTHVVAAADAGAAPTKAKDARMWMTAGGRSFAVTLADTDAARTLAARLPITLDMTDLNDNEKKFDLPKNLPANASRPGTIRNGDLMLWGDNTLVVFYKTFDSTLLVHASRASERPRGLAQALGRGNVRVHFSAQH